MTPLPASAVGPGLRILGELEGFPPAAETFDLAPGAILPLALFREHFVSREAALDAFRNNERPWHIALPAPA